MWSGWRIGNGGRGVPDEKDFEGGDVLRWDGIAVFPNASKLAKLVSELPWGAAATQNEKLTKTMNVEIKTMAGQWPNDKLTNIYCSISMLSYNSHWVNSWTFLDDRGGGCVLPDWLGKCAKLAKLEELAFWAGGAAKMSPPRSESKSNFFSCAALWACERPSPGDWVAVEKEKKKKIFLIFSTF